MLSKEQVRFFEVFGYLKLPGLLQDCIPWITQEFEKVFVEDTKIARHDGTQRSCIVPFIDQRERLCTLLDDTRIHETASALLGSDYNYMGSDGNYYVGDTGWHRDGEHDKYRHIKMAFYLDQLDGSNGALRVIPGSHNLHDQYGSTLKGVLRNSADSLGIAGQDVPAQVLEVEPGDLLIFNHNLMHSSWNGGKQRRMFTINLCQRYADKDLPELRNYLSGLARFWIDRAYGEKMVATASPRRRQHLEQVMANDGHLAELSAKARIEMKEPARG